MVVQQGTGTDVAVSESWTAAAGENIKFSVKKDPFCTKYRVQYTQGGDAGDVTLAVNRAVGLIDHDIPIKRELAAAVADAGNHIFYVPPGARAFQVRTGRGSNDRPVLVNGLSFVTQQDGPGFLGSSQWLDRPPAKIQLTSVVGGGTGGPATKVKVYNYQGDAAALDMWCDWYC
jgi:hypothetical protein